MHLPERYISSNTIFFKAIISNVIAINLMEIIVLCFYVLQIKLIDTSKCTVNSVKWLIYTFIIIVSNYLYSSEGGYPLLNFVTTINKKSKLVWCCWPFVKRKERSGDTSIYYSLEWSFSWFKEVICWVGVRHKWKLCTQMKRNCLQLFVLVVLNVIDKT